MTVKVRSYMGETVDFQLLKLKQELSAAAAPGEAAISIVPEEIDAAILFKRPDLQNKLLGRLARHTRNAEPTNESAPVNEPTGEETINTNAPVDAPTVDLTAMVKDTPVTTNSIHKRGNK